VARTKPKALVPHPEKEPTPAEAEGVRVESLPANFVVAADAEGRRAIVTAKDEIVIECGKASITLRRNGRIVVKGTYVETRAEGTNRIKGAKLHLN
jgi:hypothetical protein